MRQKQNRDERTRVKAPNEVRDEGTDLRHSDLEDWELELMAGELEEGGEVSQPSGSTTSIYSVRFQRDELRRIREAATADGISTGTFIRHAVASELARHKAPVEDLSRELDDLADRVHSVSAALRSRPPHGRAG